VTLCAGVLAEQLRDDVVRMLWHNLALMDLEQQHHAAAAAAPMCCLAHTSPAYIVGGAAA